MRMKLAEIPEEKNDEDVLRSRWLSDPNSKQNMDILLSKWIIQVISKKIDDSLFMKKAQIKKARVNVINNQKSPL